MVGGTVFGRRPPPEVIQREIFQSLGPQPSLAAKITVSKHRRDTFVLDTDFVLIEGHPAIPDLEPADRG